MVSVAGIVGKYSWRWCWRLGGFGQAERVLGWGGVRRQSLGGRMGWGGAGSKLIQ